MPSWRLKRPRSSTDTWKILASPRVECSPVGQSSPRPGSDLNVTPSRPNLLSQQIKKNIVLTANPKGSLWEARVKFLPLLPKFSLARDPKAESHKGRWRCARQSRVLLTPRQRQPRGVIRGHACIFSRSEALTEPHGERTRPAD